MLAACGSTPRRPVIERGTPIVLTAEQAATVHDSVSTKFYLPRAVHMHPMSASRSSKGVVTVCGLADAIGQEGIGEMLGYRSYNGVLVPETSSFAVIKLANTELDQAVNFRFCRETGAPIIIPPEAAEFARRATGK